MPRRASKKDAMQSIQRTFEEPGSDTKKEETGIFTLNGQEVELDQKQAPSMLDTNNFVVNSNASLIRQGSSDDQCDAMELVTSENAQSNGDLELISKQITKKDNELLGASDKDIYKIMTLTQKVPKQRRDQFAQA